MPNPSNSAFSAAGPQSIAEVWTTSGARKRRAGERPGLTTGRAARNLANRAQDEDRRRDPLDLDLHRAWQPMLQRQAGAAVGLESELDADAP
ncbi:MAG TPA: hypothetical protein VKM72_06140 [Thermoanaerobaculia bacterium]|nr:hypothetical protein [Thermoanaerobaculia bacterium]